MIEVDALTAAWQLIASRLPEAIVINIVMAIGAVLARSLTWMGGVVGTLIGIVIYAGSGGAGWLVLCMAFALAVSSSHVGRGRKVAAGLEEDRGGRRGAGNALANCLVGASGAVLIVARADDRLGALILVAGLTAGASDTVASEIGKAFGRTARAVPSMQRVPVGTPGAVSVVGTIAGVAAATVMTLAAAALNVPGFTTSMIPAIIVGATAGAFVESALASRFEADGSLNNHVLNFINTSVAAAAAGAVFFGR